MDHRSGPSHPFRPYFLIKTIIGLFDTFALYFWKAEIKFGILNHWAFFWRFGFYFFNIWPYFLTLSVLRTCSFGHLCDFGLIFWTICDLGLITEALLSQSGWYVNFLLLFLLLFSSLCQLYGYIVSIGLICFGLPY